MRLEGTGWTPPEDGVGLRDLQGWDEPIGHIAAALGCGVGEPFPTGSDIVFGDGSTVIKLTRPKWSAEIEAEASLLQRVRGALPVRTPQVLATGTVEGWPWVAMTHVPGTQIAELWPSASRAERDRWAQQIGEVIRALHTLPVEADPGWSAWLRHCESTVLDRHRGPLVEGIPAFLRPDEPLPPVLLHTEIYEQHVLIEGGDVVGLIDFADGRVGDPRYELPALLELMFRDDVQALRVAIEAAGIPIDAEGMLRWSLRHRYGQLARWTSIWPEAASLQELARGIAPLACSPRTTT